MIKASIFLKNLFLFLIIVLIIAGCHVASSNKKTLNVKGTFAFQSLKDQQVFKLKTYKHNLYAGTSGGLVSFDFSNRLKHTGTFMKKKNVRAFLILGKHNWLISATIKGDTASANIYKSTDQGNSWSVYTNGFGGERFAIPITMDARIENPSILFARDSFFTNVAKSIDGGKSWKSVNQTWTNPLVGTSIFVKIDRNNPNIIWAGGATAIFFSSLLKSTNGGKTWKRMVGLYIYGNTVYALGIQAGHSNHILAGLNGGVEKSTDGGESWHPVLNQSAIYTFTHSARDPEVVYSSGLNGSTGRTGTLFFAASADFGDTWQTVEMPDSPMGIYVNDMVSVMQDGHEVLYLGTNKGVYSYTFEK